MEFVRKKRRGQNQKVRKTWFSKENYRIIWRREVWGVRVPARFQATVRVVIPNYSTDGETVQMWDFTDETHRLFKTRKKAEESCERHFRLWTKACAATGLRSLLELFGKLPRVIPVWARKSLNRKVYEFLNRPQTAKYVEEECDNQSAPPEISATSPIDNTGSDRQTDGPASPAKVGDESIHRKAPSTTANAKLAGVPEKEQKPRSRRRTAKSSNSTGKRKRNTTTSSKSAKPRSRASRTKKSRVSAN